MKKIFGIFKGQIVLIIASVLAIITSFISKPKIEYIDFRVLIILFNLMIIVAGFKKYNVLDNIASKIINRCKSERGLKIALVFITFFAAMLVTNDVALITFVPITLIIGRRLNIDIIKTTVLQTIAANLGSSLTPMGNPQNLYIYSHYKISAIEFFYITYKLVLMSLILLIIMISLQKNNKITVQYKGKKIENIKTVFIFMVLFVFVILSVLNLIDYRIIFIITLVCTLIIDRELYKNVDYSLLLTFVSFFIFIGNVSNMNSIRNVIEPIVNLKTNTYIISILLSQIISNVPATMLLSSFSNCYKSMLLGVNIGGLGTLIASLASLISYKLFAKEYKDKTSKYFIEFTKYNIIGLIILGIINYFIL